MSDHYWLSEAQLERIKPYFPRAHGRPRIDDRRVISGMIHIIRDGPRRRDARAVHGPHEALCSRFVRWSRMGMFGRIYQSLASERPKPQRSMIDAGHL